MSTEASTTSGSTHKIQCWGHRGASAFLPENTLASFRAAILEGAEGIESDVHLTSDGVILMFHDPTLDRTTDGKGKIKELPWNGVIENVRTKKEPVQPIPRFEELIAMIMEPENQHVILNIDVKIQSDPDELFPLMAKIIQTYDDWKTVLAPRIIMGLWHPLFLTPCRTHLPNLKRFHIGLSTYIAKKYFWPHVDGFSMAFPMLITADGQKFLKQCKEGGKEITVWTVNDREEMIVSAGWGVKAILTDKVKFCNQVRKEWEEDPSKIQLPYMRSLIFPWTSWKYYSLAHIMLLRWVEDHLQKNAYSPGKLQTVQQPEETSEGAGRVEEEDLTLLSDGTAAVQTVLPGIKV